MLSGDKREQEIARLPAVRTHIAEQLGVPADQIPLTTKESMLPYDRGGMTLSAPTE
jgi:energy-converting hydrogenase Eha subunit F